MLAFRNRSSNHEPIRTSLPRDVIALGTKLRILPLGDSITFGWNGTSGTDGYRLELSNHLSGSEFLFVGTQRSGQMADNYNEGHPGYTTSQIAGAMGPALEQRPNVILLHTGTNDLNRAETAEEPWSEAPRRLGSLIDEVLEKCPGAVVLVAKIINAKNADTEARIKTFNEAVPGAVKQRADQGQKVAVVDQSVVGVDELVDGLHPTTAGYAHMGDVWFEGIKVAAESLITLPVGSNPSWAQK
ncbi:carbohydrate esterase family 3 protein [Zopfia rhizophila CBS 207.26]|uniref:Carbohydrate esterase family 3 protein n=1 Tax=Zopfia rhizophila CBS 207.26 TaxID=1314779 RepID=A0A6A6DE08_9PEZI|nr:carbohydrate esterase family 3 protein [Zopfia rhizophila CBS 207.26]